MNNEARKKISVIGCGWLGAPLGKRLVEEGYPIVKGSTTSVSKLEPLRKMGIEPYVAHLDPFPQGDHWEELLDVNTLVVDIPPRSSQQGEEFHPQQMDQLVKLIRQTKIAEIIYVSSISVYPELSRTTAEEDVTTMQQSAAPQLVEAENKLAELRKNSLNVTILRCGGLMGYDRIPGKYVRGKKELTAAENPVNYIHRDDAVEVVVALIARSVPNEVFNMVAPEHPTRRQVYDASCEEFGWQPPTYSDIDPALPFKLVSSAKLLQAVDYRFLYPDPLGFYYTLPEQDH
jgi:nucleoside-diphosphate-sugar epimerase